MFQIIETIDNIFTAAMNWIADTIDRVTGAEY